MHSVRVLVLHLFVCTFCHSFGAMKLLLAATSSYVCVAAGLLISRNNHLPNVIDGEKLLPRAANCENTATSRSCWGEYDIDTDYYDVTPDTGVTREVRVET